MSAERSLYEMFGLAPKISPFFAFFVGPKKSRKIPTKVPANFL